MAEVLPKQGFGGVTIWGETGPLRGGQKGWEGLGRKAEQATVKQCVCFQNGALPSKK